MRGTSVIIPVLCCAAAPAAAQIDPVTVAQGQILGAMNQGYADRARGRVARPPTTRARMTVICTRELPAYRQQYGADHPDVRLLDQRCRKAGY